MGSVNGSAGAGGEWPTVEECEDPRVIAQEKGIYCGCACALMVLVRLEITDLPTQDELFQLGGDMIFSVESLADVMNEACVSCKPAGKWLGQGVQPIQGSDYYQIINELTTAGPWIAHLRDIIAKIGHFVVVESQINNLLHILDPAAPGTSYEMDVDTFLEFWNYQAVYFEGQ